MIDVKDLFESPADIVSLDLLGVYNYILVCKELGVEGAEEIYITMRDGIRIKQNISMWKRKAYKLYNTGYMNVNNWKGTGKSAKIKINNFDQEEDARASLGKQFLLRKYLGGSKIAEAEE